LSLQGGQLSTCQRGVQLVDDAAIKSAPVRGRETAGRTGCSGVRPLTASEAPHIEIGPRDVPTTEIRTALRAAAKACVSYRAASIARRYLPNRSISYAASNPPT
jgi:hypothetical protein